MATKKNAAQKSAPKKASKKAAAKKAAPVLRTAWNAGLSGGQKDEEGRSMLIHGVRVGGKDYTSTWKAWTALKVGSRGQCIRFRKELKQAKGGKLSFSRTSDGKAFQFSLIPSQTGKAE